MSQPKIFVSLLSRDQEFQVWQAADAQFAAERAGFKAEILYADQSAIQQIQQLFQAIHAPAEQRPLALVVETVVGEGLERVARNATGRGIGWVLLARRVGYLEALRREHPYLPISSVSGDQLEIGRIQGRQFRALLPRGGVVLYVRGPNDTSDAQERLEGAREATVGARIEFRILEGTWTEASAEKTVTNMLRLKTAESFRPDLVGAQNDAMAIGARRAALALRKDWAGVPFTGCDGLPEGGQRLVNMRQLAATIVTPSNAGPAIDLVARWHKTKEQPPFGNPFDPGLLSARRRARQTGPRLGFIASGSVSRLPRTPAGCGKTGDGIKTHVLGLFLPLSTWPPREAAADSTGVARETSADTVAPRPLASGACDRYPCRRRSHSSNATWTPAMGANPAPTPRRQRRQESLSFLADNRSYTKRFAFYVGRRCRASTIKDIAEELHLDWHTVKGLEKQYMREQLRRAGSPAPKVIGIDEISIRKGHTLPRLHLAPSWRR